MIKYKGKILTDEQERHINTIINYESDYAIQAPPGSGKTFLLLALARKLKGNGLSISFNKLLAQEASKKFNSSMTCKTGHALAYSSVGYKYRDRLKKLTGKHLADSQDIGSIEPYNSPSNKAYLILNTIKKYCYSADPIITNKHIPKLTLIENQSLSEIQQDLTHHAQQIFNEMSSLSSTLPITHDIYLKLWALSSPTIKQDFIFFDEYQDSNPVISQVINAQKCQKIFVGDQFQQIYSWRGAVNALQQQNTTKLYITQSFRFGQPIADISNQIIESYYPTDLIYKPFNGNPSIKSAISYKPLANINCIICRTNNGVINETIKALTNNQKVHILGGTKALTYLINSIEQLKTSGFTNHPDLFLFKNFIDLKEYSESPIGGDIKVILKLIETYTRSRLLSILNQTLDKPTKSSITITTAHKSKGLEWETVRLANDFKLPNESKIPTQEETNILYVAASRALHNLDLSSCQACQPDIFRQAIKINQQILADKESDAI